jgi:LPXTG-motif cell wall-anchored protein
VSRLGISKRLLTIGLLFASFLALLLPSLVLAMPQYAAATGQPCSTCHVNPAGGGARNAFGQRFEAIPTHSTDPLGAYRQLTQAQATPAPTVAATRAPTVAATPAATPAATAAATPRATVVATPAATPAATAAPTTLPRTGDIALSVLVLGAGAMGLAGFALRRWGR